MTSIKLLVLFAVVSVGSISLLERMVTKREDRTAAPPRSEHSVTPSSAGGSFTTPQHSPFVASAQTASAHLSRDAAEPEHGAGRRKPETVPHQQSSAPAKGLMSKPGLRPNVPADFNPDLETPLIDSTAYVDPMASVIGHVEIGRRVYVAPFASARGDEGQPLHIGDESNLQDGVVIHALETFQHGKPHLANTYEVNGRRYAVYIGTRVSLAHQSQVHGPAWVEDEVFVGMQALVFKSHVGKGCVIEPGAKVVGVTIPPGRYVRTGSVVADQYTADQLPAITDGYPFRTINKAVVHVNTSLADGYSGRSAGAGH